MRKKMKILHIQQYYNDGMGYQENILPYYHASLGHEVLLITSKYNNGFNKGKRKGQIGVYSDRNFKVKRIETYGEFKNRFVLFKNLYKEIKEFNPDYIFHHSVTAPSLITVAKYKKENKNIFLVADNHADWVISGTNKLWKIFYYNIVWKNILKKIQNQIDIFFGVTPGRCMFLSSELGINGQHVKLLPIGADTELCNQISDKRDVLSKFNLNPDNILIVHGGKITPEKKVDKIIEAFMLIKNEKINLVLFGDIKDENVKNLIKQDDRIIYLGWLNRNDTLRILKNSDIGIWNTQHTTLMEDAIAVGLPIIIMYYGATSHLIDNNGFYLYEGSVKEIYDKLSFVTSNKEIISEMKNNSNQMMNILSYKNIANESLAYIENREYESIYSKFLTIPYTDYNFKFFKYLKQK